MDVREKIVELIYRFCSGLSVSDIIPPYGYENLADFLISNGVTVQEWVSVKERIPQENEPDGTLCETVQVLLNNGKVSVGWCNRRTKLWWHMDYDKDYFISKDYDHTPVIAWQPLAHPPKGE